MTQLTLDKKTARNLYPKAAPEFKTMLEETFGKAYFSQDITERIFTFEDVCAEAGKNPKDYIIPNREQFKGTDEEYDEAVGVVAFSKLQLICKVFREGVVLDWNNTSQRKYFPWMLHTAGSGFSFFGYGCGRTSSSVGARLSVDTAEKARHIGLHFADVYNQLFICK